jgi:murein DD-endopeptidase MepM/ murein hydrolase activator NlpD
VLYGITQKRAIKRSINAQDRVISAPAAEQRADTTVKICDSFYTPFDEPQRDSYETIKRRVVGRYGEYRRSPRVGHKHAGVDLRGEFSESVYAIGDGQVFEVFKSFPNRSVVLRHHMPDSSFLYSVYTHLEDITVMVGDWVNKNSALGRLFTEEELEASDFGTANHVHLEIRTSYSDYGTASWRSMSMDALNKYCMDPLAFFREYLQ